MQLLLGPMLECSELSLVAACRRSFMQSHTHPHCACKAGGAHTPLCMQGRGLPRALLQAVSLTRLALLLPCPVLPFAVCVLHAVTCPAVTCPCWPPLSFCWPPCLHMLSAHPKPVVGRWWWWWQGPRWWQVYELQTSLRGHATPSC